MQQVALELNRQSDDQKGTPTLERHTDRQRDYSLHYRVHFIITILTRQQVEKTLSLKQPIQLVSSGQSVSVSAMSNGLSESETCAKKDK